MKKTEAPSDRRSLLRQGLIVLGVLAVHALLLSSLFFEFERNQPAPIVFVPAQITLEPQMPVVNAAAQAGHSPVVREVEVGQKSAPPSQQTKPQQHSSVQRPMSTTATEPAPAITKAAEPAQQSVNIANKPMVQTSTNHQCNQARPLNITSNLVRRNTTIDVLIRRNQSAVVSARLQSSTGDARLDELIQQRAMGLKFVSNDAQCDGLSFIISVALKE